jgi:hypothetical protein
LLESALKLRNGTTVFVRAENLANDELFAEASALHHEVFTVTKVGIGAMHDLRALWRGRFGVGAVYNFHYLPDTLDLFYGDDPNSWLCSRGGEFSGLTPR